MQELVDIVVNVLANLKKGKKVMIKKPSDTSFVFIGEGEDNNSTPYEFKINLEFQIIQKEEDKNNGNN